MTKPALRLSWRREPNETGLGAVCQSPRGYELRTRVNDKLTKIITVSLAGRASTKPGKFYWYGGCPDLCIPSHNTLWVNTSFDTLEAAKADAEKHVRKHLSLEAEKVKS